MALEEYRRKRDFTKTPEPPPAVKAKTGPELFFCVQKHLASHLHYDFRLEHNGVLLSWAVPKGPRSTRRSSGWRCTSRIIRSSTATFEGVIPEGYGAGIVMLWDRGTWTPEVEDVEAALKKGDLKLTLDGDKLKGSWVLVRTRGSYAGGGGTESWLLIKHRDDWAGDVDIAEFAPLSVKSGGDFADILAAGQPRIWQSQRPAQGRRRRRDVQDDHRAGARDSKADARRSAENCEPADATRATPRNRASKAAKTRRRPRQRKGHVAAKARLRSGRAVKSRSEQPLRQHGPDRVREPPPIVARDLAAPERALDHFAVRRHVAESRAAPCAPPRTASALSATASPVLTMTTSTGRPIASATRAHGVGRR